MKMLNPHTYWAASPMVRKEYMKSMMAVAGAWSTFAGLAKAYGEISGDDDVSVSMDADNTDFAKIRIGDTRFDPAGGFQQYIVLAHRMASGQFTSSVSGNTKEYGSGFGIRVRKDALYDFLTQKFAPIPSYGSRAMSASTEQPFAPVDETVRMFIPLIAQSLSEIIQTEPELLGLTVPANIIGMGSNTYSRDPNTRMFGDWTRQFDVDFTGGPIGGFRLPLSNPLPSDRGGRTRSRPRR